MQPTHDQIKRFWSWFEEHSSSFLDADVETVLSSIESQVRELGAGILVEVGGQVQAAERELILTSHGSIEWFDTIDEIVRLSPRIPNWKIRALKPGLFEHFELTYEGERIATRDLMVRAQAAASLAEARLLVGTIKKLQDSSLLRTRKALPLIFEAFLGERLFAERVPTIVLVELPENLEAKGFTSLSDYAARLVD